MSDLQRHESATLAPNDRLSALLAQAATHAENAKSERTKKEYATDFALFREWCADMGVQVLPCAPETLAAYITDLANAGRKASTIQRKLSAITVAHKTAGFDSPAHSLVVETVWTGIRNVIGTAPAQKKALTVAQLRRIVAEMSDSMIGLRDKALLLIGFTSAMRREELAGVDAEDLVFEDGGVRITLRRSKTNQDGCIEIVGVPYGEHADTCPVRALKAWLSAAGIESGAVFRSVNKGGAVSDVRISDKDVARRLKKYVEEIGLDASEFAGHSLRRGLATEAARAGKSQREIKKQTRHKSDAMVQRYIEDGELFRENAAAGLGL